MKFSVIIPIYNVEDYLERCLDSLIKQKIEDTEIILINDGSLDRSKDICNRYVKNYSNIILINKTNSGTGDSRNVGMNRAKGEYIYFCDPDDYIENHFFETMSELIKTKKDLYMFGYWDEIEYNNQIVNRKKMQIRENKEYDRNEFFKNFSQLYATNMLYTLWNKLYNRRFLEENNIKFSTVSMGQDTRFNLEVYRYIHSFLTCDKCFYHYTIARKDSSTSKYRANRMKMKIEEEEILMEFLIDFHIPCQEVLLSQVRENILLDCCNQISLSNLSNREKNKELLKQISLFKLNFPNFSLEKAKKTTYILLKNKTYLYLFLKKIQNVIEKIEVLFIYYKYLNREPI